MQDKNELNDIILNRGGSANNNKKIVLAVATLGVILIIVVMLMNSITSNNSTDNLPQAVLPPKPDIQALQQPSSEPLFEEVKVVKDENQDNNNLDEIAKKLKQESQDTQGNAPIATETTQKQEEVKEKKVEKETPKDSTKAATQPKEKAPMEKGEKSPIAGGYYIQVGSFSKHEPNKKFLISITEKGYNYTYQNVTKDSISVNKVLVGPFKNEKEAKEALRVIRASVEAGAFITKI